ncbi:glycine cleavage system protein GcvH [Salininema proteolyticum]|uniref:Glycine cleavage system H protein n=1 Tax=Salininema proteolyticum TaxID=1607685 RepID=A0ABV8TTJ3_9ACTN
MTVPKHLKYTSEHEWLDVSGETATVGVTEHAAELLGDVVFVDLPEAGDTVDGGEVCGEIESTKSVSDLYAPADGEVTGVNEEVVTDPALLNADPYGKGWLFTMKITGETELLDAAAYEALTEGN